MKRRHESNNNKQTQTQIRIVALMASIAVLMLGLIAAPSMISAQNIPVVSNSSTQNNVT
jgi:hypothetical protein